MLGNSFQCHAQSNSISVRSAVLQVFRAAAFMFADPGNVDGLGDIVDLNLRALIIIGLGTPFFSQIYRKFVT